jgi:HAD superfamily hydrolase (TIGR01509 family)
VKEKKLVCAKYNWERQEKLKKAIFWDNDGVLVDTEKYYYLATKELFSRYGAELTREDYLKYYLQNNTGAWHLLGNAADDEGLLNRLRNERGQIYLSYLQTGNHSVPGAEYVLSRLYKKYKMGVVTSSRREHFNAIHKKTGFLKYFDFTLVREDYNLSKPDPESYLKALEVANVKPEEAIVVEDSERGMTAAHKAGVECWIIPTEFSNAESFKGAEKILSNITEVLEYL